MRGLRSSNVHPVNTALLDLYKPMTKISVELVQRINGTFVVTVDPNVTAKIVMFIVDNMEFVDMNEEDGRVDRATDMNQDQEYNFLYCVPSTDIYVSSSTAFFLPFDLATWLLTVTSGVAVAASLMLINEVGLQDSLLAALAAFLYQSMGSNICRKHVTPLLWSLSCVILSSLYVCGIEALFIVFTGKGIGTLKEMLDHGYVISLLDDHDSQTLKYMTEYCGEVINCDNLFGNRNVTTIFTDVKMQSFLNPDFHNYLTDPGVGPVMYMNERLKIKAMVAWLNSHIKPLGTTCFEGKEHTNFPASRRIWGTDGLSYVVLMDALVRIHECGILGMLMQMQTMLLETFYGSQLKEAYDQRGKENDSEAKPWRRVVKSSPVFSLGNQQVIIVFKLWALALAFSFIMLTLEALHDRFRRHCRRLGARARWQQVKHIYGALKRENHNMLRRSSPTSVENQWHQY